MRSTIIAAALLAVTTAAFAQQQQAPTFATTKVEGTDNVYIFRYQGYQAMFVVTPAGVIATDPISYGRPEAAKAYIDEVRKITQAPIRYLIYSHHHYDHIAGGKPFKDAGATVVAHKRARNGWRRSRPPTSSFPIRPWTPGARSSSAAPRSSSSTPGEPLQLVAGDAAAQGEGHLRRRLQLARHGALAACSERFLSDRMGGLAEADAGAGLGTHDPGHPGPGGRLGTKKDMEQQLAFMTDLSAEVKKASDAGKCFDPATKEVRLPQHATLQGYEQNIEWNVHRWCGYWGRGI